MVSDYILFLYFTVKKSKFKYLIGDSFQGILTATRILLHNFLIPFSGVIHLGVVCDSCLMDPIAGIRWKCSDQSCPDYDLCTPCYMNDKHDLNHIFTRFTSQKETGFVFF